MAQKIGELFTVLAGMAGIAATDPRLKDIQSLTTEVSDELLAEFNGKLTTVESAKNNPVLKAFFTARALNPIDEILKEKLEDAGFTPDQIAAINADSSTPKKLRAFVDELKKMKAAAPDKSPEKAALQAEIDKLQKSLADKELWAKGEISAAQKQANDNILQYAIDSVLSTMPYANKELDMDVNVLTAKGIIQKALADKKAQVIRQADNSLKLVQSENPDLDYYNEQHQPVNFSDFTKSTLAAKKMLITSEPPPANPKAPIIIPGQGDKGNANLVTALDKQIAELNAA